jgi:D-arabinose 1-dehydrogenase-like Zn-dependent alcohol dehydrogenase
MDNHCMAPRWIGIQRPGGYADHLLIPHPKYLVDASGIDPAWAATLSCSGGSRRIPRYRSSSRFPATSG